MLTSRRRPALRPRSVLVLAATAAAVGVAAARAEGATSPAPAPAAPRPTLTVPSRVPLAVGVACPVRRAPSTGSKVTAPGQPPSQALLDAFGVLRRARTADDELPAEALAALRARGLEPVDSQSARLLRSTPSGGRAWVVPVPDVSRATLGFGCAAPLVLRPAPAPSRRPTSPSTRAAPAPVPRVAPRARRLPPVPVLPTKPQEGVAVVATGDAAAGGGGSLADLLRGRAPVTVDPCGGPQRSMLGVSGIVPDGVTVVFLTARDGTAVRSDVVDNAYSFLVPRTRNTSGRYVVWSSNDGTPHVQPLPFVGGPVRGACPAAITRLARVTPDSFAGCGSLLSAPANVARLQPGSRPVTVVVPALACRLAFGVAPLAVPMRPPKRR